MGSTREGLTRTQSNVISFYKKQLKALKNDFTEQVDISSRLNNLEKLRSLDYEINNLLSIKVERELKIKEEEHLLKKEIANIKAELDLLKVGG